MKKKFLIVGQSANACSLAKELSKKHEVYITLTSDTINDFAHSVDIREKNIKELLEFVVENGIDTTVAISPDAIKADIATVFSRNKQSIFAPSAAAASIAYDKAKAKKLLYKLHIPTPKFGIFDKQNMVADYLKNQRIPFVIKTNESNSAVILTSLQSAKNILDSIFIDKNNKVIIEDYIYGTPFSFYAITDGYKALPFGSSLTYKHSLAGNGGQLTSGMGACSPNYKLSIEQEYYIMENVIYPTLSYLEEEQSAYMGILGVNGIISDDGKISILGWQTFTQDCDTTSILQIQDDDLDTLFNSCIIGSFSDEVNLIRQKNAYSVSLVLKNNNKQNFENSINGLDLLEDDTILTLYPNIKKNKYMEFEAEYGNVLILTGIAGTVSGASNKVYNEASEIKFKGLYYRKDICNSLK